jgi:hypothetical protein
MTPEEAVKDVAEKLYFSVEEIRRLICNKGDVYGQKPFANEALLTEKEVYLIKRMLIKAALRTFETTQKTLKKESRSKNDTSELMYKKWKITTLFREYARLRGKDLFYEDNSGKRVEIHSLDKWDGSNFY